MTWTVFFGGGDIDIDTLCNLKFYFLESQITMSHEDMTMYNFGILRLFYVKKRPWSIFTRNELQIRETIKK